MDHCAHHIKAVGLRRPFLPTWPAVMHEEVSFCFVPFRFNAFAGFVSGFQTSRNLGARFSFSVTWDQMLVNRGDWVPLEHSFGATDLSYRFHTFFKKQISRLFQDSDWFFKGSKIQINPQTPKISMLILLTAFHTLYFLVEFNRFPELSRTSGIFPGLSRFSRTCTSPGPKGKLEFKFF